MRLLFSICHPSKFHLFRITINTLMEKGHEVDIIIISKDVLEDLVVTEGWKYKNIFPKGRKIRNLPTYLGAALYTYKSFFRFKKYLSRKKYDLIVTDDLIVINARIRKIPTIYFQDDDITTVPQTIPLLIFANHILSPSCSNLGRFETKKIPFDGFKQLGYLHPNKFTPDTNFISQFNPDGADYFLIRIVSLKAIHDVGKNGLNDQDILRLIEILNPHGKVYISSERPLSSTLRNYLINIKATEIMQAIYFSKLFITDSNTMSAEAGILGTPFVRCCDFINKINYLEEIENEYLLGYGISTNNKERMFTIVKELIKKPNLKEEWSIKRNNLIAAKIDLTEFMLWLIENYPGSINTIRKDPNYQWRFK